MKQIRSIAALLLLIDGILHSVSYATTPANSGSIGTLLFGILYIGTGLILLGKKQYPLYLGILLPIVGMTLSFIKFGLPEFFSLSALFKLIGVIVVICCVSVLVHKKQSGAGPQ
jgi:hypothetical protein